MHDIARGQLICGQITGGREEAERANAAYKETIAPADRDVEIDNWSELQTSLTYALQLPGARITGKANLEVAGRG